MPEPNGRWQIARTVTVGDLITIVLVVVSIFTVWYKQDSRLTALENLGSVHQQQLNELTPAVKKTNETLILLNQRLDDFPLHRHLKSGAVVYPNTVNFDGYAKSDPSTSR